MTCTETKDLLPLHLAGELGDDAAFRAHLALCEACARREELHRRVWDLAGLAADADVPPAALRAVTARIRRRRVPWVRAASVAAAALFVWLATGPKPPPAAMLCAPADSPRSAYVEPTFGELTVEEGAAPGPLGLRSHRVTVEIGDWGMRTEIEEVFVNGTDRRLEGTFEFPLPADASLSRFAMEVNGTLVEGELVERVRARVVYEGIVRRMQDPALLEWMPGNVFKARIFPIEPRGEKRIVLAYTQAPRMWNGAIRYVYPLVSEKTKQCPPEELSVRVDLSFGREIKRLECPTHRADVARPDARSARVSLSVRNARPTQDLQLRVELEPDEIEFAAHCPAGEDGTVGIAFAPRAAAPASGGGSYVFVIDRSARMGEKDLAVARRTVERMLDGLGGEDRAGLAAHHVGVQTLPLERVTPERRRAVRDFLDVLRGEGASDVAGAIAAAAALAPEGATLVYVGKGVPTWGEAELHAPAGRVFRSVLIGSGANEEGLSRLGGMQAIAPGGDVEAEIGAVARTIALRPVELDEVSLEGAHDLVPARVGPVYPGERVHFFARVSGERGTLLLRGRADGRPFERRRELVWAAGPAEARSLPRLWAQRVLQARLAECRRQGEPRELVDGIVAMSRQYQVMTPYTSFLVLESEQAYRDHQIERAKRREEESRREEEQKRRVMAPPPSEMEKIIQEVARGRTEEEQGRIAESQKHTQVSLTCLNRGEFEKAKIEAQKAVEAWPENIAARKVLNDLQQITVGGGLNFGARSVAEDAAAAFRVQVEQAQIEITKHVRDGERYLKAGMHDEAAREFENAEFKIEAIPYEVRAMQDLLLQVRDFRSKARGAWASELGGGKGAASDWDGVLWRWRAEAAGREQSRSSWADERYRMAERYYQAGDYEKAQLECEKALRVKEGHAPARALHMEVEFLLGRGRTTPAPEEYDKFMREAIVRHQQTLVEIDNAMARGQRMYNAGDYGSAEREFRKIQEYAKWMPTGIELEARRRQAGDLLKRSREAGFSNAEVAAPLPGMKQEIVQKMARLLELSYTAFDQKQFDRGIRLCDELLLIDPHYSVAWELKEDLEKTRHKEEYYNILAKKVEQWKRLTDDDATAAIPWSQTVRFPSREEWAELSNRITDSVLRHEGAGASDEDPDLLAIHRKLDTMKIDLSFRDAKMDDILAYLRDFSGLNIVVDAAVNSAVDPGRRMDVSVKEGLLKDALRRMLAREGLAYVVTEEKVVLLTTPEKARRARGAHRGPKGISELDEEPTPEEREILGKLASIRVTMALENVTLGAVVDRLREISGLNIHVSGVDNAEIERISFQVSDQVLDVALQRLLAPRGLTHLVRDGVVLITRADQIKKQVKLELYDVQDLLSSPGREAGEELVKRVRETVEPSSWVEEDGKALRYRSGLLVVRAPAATHAAIRAFLAGERLERIRRKIREETRIPNQESRIR